MTRLAKILGTVVAVEHLYIVVLEMVLWNTPLGHRTFGLTPELAAQTRTLALNQGLYNGFLAAGLLWALYLVRDADWQRRIASYFLGCVVVAGIVGGLSVKPSIALVQGLPALAALLALRLGRAR